ncbi:MAG TPA: helix-turn-helix transcriptional regulator [Burkholderiaceae bacterium]|nr:helix-turn-helix transcriptional regulator [Burkholderiaceae bacterium]
MEELRRQAFADFLRSRRERLSPQDLGLPSRARRRTPGLRREEVAELAGIGVDWYIRLEQGRAVSPSAATLDALARALRLNKVEHSHLRALTRGAERRALAGEPVSDALKRLVDGLGLPAYVLGRRWDVLHWNAEADRIFAFGRLPPERRNVLLNVLTNPAARKLFGTAWADEARRMIGQFRASHDLFADDPAFIDLLSALRAGCPEFNGWWKAHEVRLPAPGTKRLRHPTLGVLRFEHTSFLVSDEPGLRLVIYNPV